MSMTSKSNLNVWLARQTTTHLFTLHQSISNELKLRELPILYKCSWYMTFTLHMKMQQQTVFISNSFLKCFQAHIVTSFKKNHVGFYCNACWGYEGYRRLLLVFGLAPYMQRFLWIRWIFWWSLLVKDDIHFILSHLAPMNLFNCGMF